MADKIFYHSNWGCKKLDIRIDVGEVGPMVVLGDKKFYYDKI